MDRRSGRDANAEQPSQASAFVRAGPLTSLPAILRDLGCEPQPILKSAGFKLSQFEDPDIEVPYVPVSRLLERCVAATGCEHFGLLMGEHADPSCLGIVGFMLRAAPDVGTALQDLLRHLDLHDQGGMATLVLGEGVTLLGYAIHLSNVTATDQIYDLAIAVACNIMRSLCDVSWRPAEVLLSRSRPRNIEPYKRFFRAPLRFGAVDNAVAFSSHWLDHRPPGSDPLLYRHLKQQVTELLALREATWANKVRRLLRKSLPTRHCSLTDAANRLSMHERTLNRRLHDEGTTFHRELENLRHEMACQLLAESRLSVSKVSMALGYSDSTAFIRAFKRWSGATPAEWRARDKPR